MTLAALLAAVTSSFGWAGFDATRKSLAMRMPVVPLAFVLIAAQLPLFGAWIALSTDPIRLTASYAVPGLLAVVLNILANLMLLKALAIAPLSLTIPFLSLTPALTALAAIPLLGEWPTERQALGIGLVVAGALLLGVIGARGRGAVPAVGGSEPPPQGAETTRAAAIQGVSLMIAVAWLWAATGPIDKLALRHASAAIHAGVQVSGVASMLLVLALARGELSHLPRLREHAATATLSVTCGAVALGLQFVAIRLTLVSLVETVKRAIGLASSVANGRLFFAEPVTGPKLVAILVMASGVALTLLG